ncbi:putative signal transducing protein [Edaphobacter bradus]|uniref:putative signal transducing protein n=1 Tax=Edaphobacter bradus TaxID=2259016 RepID=UPI0021E06118|nr:DUF2007 domain-containing protein [Edaphobacter bradus]
MTDTNLTKTGMAPDFDPENFVSIGKYTEPVEAQMAKGVLESAGFECFLQGENANNLLGAAFRARLMVHKKDEEAARQVLETPDEDTAGPEAEAEGDGLGTRDDDEH